MQKILANIQEENGEITSNNIIVCINKFNEDKDEEIEYITNYITDLGYQIELCTSYENGGNGAVKLSQKIVEICENDIDYKPLYDYDDSIINKINTICKEIYRAKNIIYTDEVIDKIKYYENNGFKNLPICIAKTQYSFTDNPKVLGAPNDFDMNVTDIKLSNGAGFIIVYMGNIMTMPGLGKNSAYLNMDIDKDGNIRGLF